MDDFQFAAITKWLCNMMVIRFEELCEYLGVPLVSEKTVWATTCIVFLGILLDGERLILSLPVEKQHRALNLLSEVTSKKKVTIKQLQVLTGYLNFLSRAIVPGCTFTRRIYTKFTTLHCKGVRQLKPHHHVMVDQELRFNCEIWKTFLKNFTASSVCRPMVDLYKQTYTVEQLNFYSDASVNSSLGIGAVYEHRWLFSQWEPGFIERCKPSIGYLELVGVVMAIVTWGHLLKNRRVVMFCDNESVVFMINNMMSSCKNCMYLLRLLTLNNMVNNRRVFARHVAGIRNGLSDALSHLKFQQFWAMVPSGMSKLPCRVTPLIWPISKVGQN